ncbi:MAG: PAS domain-containing protein [Desulfosarcinaceae bacterium]|nr:PAS domain-containing protein [Desulfosarcinaceae bacterium]
MDLNQLETLRRMASGIVGVFGERCEVVIHDFSDLARSVVHIEGDVTHRSVGAPVTSTMKRMLDEFGDRVPDKVAYKITTEDGKVLRCASIFLRDQQGRLTGCLSINFNISDFMFFAQAFADFTSLPGDNGGSGGATRVDFSQKPERSMETIVDDTVTRRGKPPAMMDRADRTEIVRRLESAGVFMVKGSVNYLARVLGVSPYTVYSYLKEVRSA